MTEQSILRNPTPLESRFAVQTHRLDVAGRQLNITAPQDPDSLLDDPITEQRYKADNYLPYWPIIWPSSLMLAHRILQSDESPPLFSHHTVNPPATPDAPATPYVPCALELGCGLGIAGIMAGWRGWHVTFTDYDPEAVDFARHNALRNGLSADCVSAFQMDWRAPVRRQFSWIIASDVLYERRLHAILLAAIKNLLAPGGTVWISDPGRNSAEDFPILAVLENFAVSEGPLKWHGDAGMQKDGVLYRLKRETPGP